MHTASPSSAALSQPTPTIHASFLTGIAQLRAEGRSQPDDHSALGEHIRRYSPQWDTPNGFADYVTTLLAEAQPHTPRPEGIVASTELWWNTGATFHGRISIRHTLTDRLRHIGGHIGYDVIPSARRQGHGTAMLAAALHVAADLGITSALLTCSPANLASRKVIEHNGGILHCGGIPCPARPWHQPGSASRQETYRQPRRRGQRTPAPPQTAATASALSGDSSACGEGT